MNGNQDVLVELCRFSPQLKIEGSEIVPLARK